MNFFRGFTVVVVTGVSLLSWSVSNAGGQDYQGQEDPNKKILKQGLLGAGVGAISAEASGGKAGTGALVGAGTNVIGGALLDTLTAPPKQQQPVYVQQAPAPQYVQQAPQYVQSSYPVQTAQTQYRQVEPAPVYVQQPAYYAPPPAEDPNKKILKQGLLGAGTGAIAASASGGKAGKGALIGAGTNVIGGALLDTLMGSGQQQQQPQPVYYQQPVAYNQGYAQQGYYQQPAPSTGTQPKKKIIRKYDSDGNVISEEEVWE
jgi:hypothetical protein